MNYVVLSCNHKPVLDLDYIKSYLRVDYDYDDKLLQKIMISSILLLEQFLRISIFEKNIKLSVGRGKFRFPILPMLKVKSCSHEDYHINSGYILPRKNLDITYVAGMQSIPADIELALLMQIAFIYDNQSMASSLTEGVKDLVKHYRNLLI